MAWYSLRPGTIRDAGAGGTPMRARRTRLWREPEVLSINRSLILKQTRRTHLDVRHDGVGPERQHLGSGVGDCNGVLEVAGELAVGGHDGPVIVQHPGLGPAHVDHRLDRDDVPGLEHVARPRGAVVR